MPRSEPTVSIKSAKEGSFGAKGLFDAGSVMSGSIMLIILGQEWTREVIMGNRVQIMKV